MEYLIALIINSLYIVGLYQSFQDGMIFEKLNPYPVFKLWKPENKISTTYLNLLSGVLLAWLLFTGYFFY